MRIVLLGAPGSGKGTQSSLLVERYAVPQISTGDILRQAMADGTSVGETARTYVMTGALVPDDLILDLVEERVVREDARPGFILDGFPRSIPQAEGLDDMLDRRQWRLHRVVKLDVPKKNILDRMTSRRVCPGCGAVYNLMTKAPQRLEICDVCGSKLIQRQDDTEETVRKRLNVYESSTAPLIDYYDGRGLLTIVNGDGPVERVFAQITSVLDAALQGPNGQGPKQQEPGA